MRLELLGGRVEVDAGRVDAPPAEIRRQVAAYAAGERRTFDLDVAYPDSFTGRVMRALSAIPYGETRTYAEVAEVLDTAPRAVGGGCGRNPVPVVVPCHRVVRADGGERTGRSRGSSKRYSDGGLGGYSAEGGVALKRRLLDHEARHA